MIIKNSDTSAVADVFRDATKRPHPGVVIKALLSDAKITIVQAARLVGFSKSGFENVIYGRTGMNPRLAVALEQAFPNAGISANEWQVTQALWDIQEWKETNDDD